MGKRLVLPLLAVLLVPVGADALGPTATDWRDSTVDGLAACPTTKRLFAVHGRSRPGLGGGVVNTTDVWAVGEDATIVHFDGSNWTAVSPPAGLDATLDLFDVYINPDGSGWAVGERATVLRLSGGVWSCYSCKAAGDCASYTTLPSGFVTCSNLYSITAMAPLASVSGSLFVVGNGGCSPPGTDGSVTCSPLFDYGGDNWPTVAFYNGTDWKHVRYCSPPIYTFNNVVSFGYSCGGTKMYTVMRSGRDTAFAPESSDYSYHLSMQGQVWAIPGSVLATNCVTGPPFPAFFASALGGNYSYIVGDTDCGDRPRALNPAQKPKTNLWVWDANGQKLWGVNAGLDPVFGGSAALQGTVKGLDILSLWGYGVGVGYGPGVWTDYASMTKSYFMLMQTPDLSRLPAPEDSASPNTVTYWQDPGSNWPRLNDVFISAYNEGWAVGDFWATSGKAIILHWVGPVVPPAALNASLTLSPTGSLNPGQWVEVVMSITNTGGAAASNLLSVLNMVPAAGLTLMCGPTCGNTVFCSGVPACPSDLPPSGPAFFTWTFSNSGCGSPISFSVTVTALDAMNGGPVKAVTGALVPGTITSIGIRKLQTPASPAALTPGDPVTYLIVARNNGTATIANLTVVDTIPAFLSGPTTDQDPLFGAPTVTGDMYEWSATGLTLSPSTDYSFTISGIAQSGCAAANASNRALAIAADACGGMTRSLSGAVTFSIPAPLVSLMVTQTQTPSNPVTGDFVTYQVVVANTGNATITTLRLVDTLPSLFFGVATDQPGGMVPQTPLSTPSGTVFSWTGTFLSFMPGMDMTFTLTGLAKPVCVVTTMRNQVHAIGNDSCNNYDNEPAIPATISLAPSLGLSADAAIFPPAPVPSTPVRFEIYVANTGITTVTNILVSDTLPPFITGVTTDQPAGFVATVAGSGGGSIYSFSDPAAALSPGAVMTVTIAGMVDPVCAPTMVNHRAWARGRDYSGCSVATTVPVASFTLNPSIGMAVEKQQKAPAFTGDTVEYYIYVTNTGSVPITRMTVTDTMPAVFVSNPGLPFAADPAFTATITGTTTRICSFVSSSVVLPAGGVLSFTITGNTAPTCAGTTAANRAFAVSWDASGCGTQMATGLTSFALTPVLEAAIGVEPTKEAEGRYLLTVVMTVTNTGATSASMFIPSADLTFSPSGPETMKVEGPSPTLFIGPVAQAVPPPCTSPCAGCSACFTWIYRTTSIEPVTFTGSNSVGIFLDPWLLVQGRCSISGTGSTGRFSDSGNVGSFALNRNLFQARMEKVHISFNVKETGKATVWVFNSVGQRVKRLFEGEAVRRIQYGFPPNELTWDGTNDSGERVSSGIYFIRLESRRFVLTRRIAVIK